MSHADWDRATQLRRQGKTDEELAAMYGVAEEYMRSMTSHGSAPADFGAAQALRNAGWSMYDISMYLRIPEEDIAAHTEPPKPKRQYENEWNAATPPIMKHNELI